MGNYSIFRNSELEVQLTSDYQDNGWSFLDGMAVHDDCNEGFIDNFIYHPTEGSTYRIRLTVSDLSNGSVIVSMGGSSLEITESGDYVLLVTNSTDEVLSLWSDANAVINVLTVLEGDQNAKTLLFNQQNNQFVGYASFTGDMVSKFLDDFISFDKGKLRIHDKNTQRNTFSNESYPSVVTFYVNLEPHKNKDFFSIKLEASEAWHVDVELPPSETNKRGQRSRIKKGNFRYEKGAYYADFFKDMNDPRFESELQALMKGGDLQGKYMKVTLTNNSTHEVELSAVEVYLSIK